MDTLTKDSGASRAVIDWVNRMLQAALAARASDVHLDWKSGGLCTRFRVDGMLGEYVEDPLPPDLHAGVINRLKVMAGLNIAESRRPQDGRIELRLSDRPHRVDIRVTAAPYVTGESVVLRMLDHAAVQKHLRLENQDLGDDELTMVKRWCHTPNGLVIATGPTGCGKTTLLYGMLNEIASPALKILTVEDPVEYQVEGVYQHAVNPALGLTFGRALRGFLRMDPDVVLIGEIRDREALHIAVQAALTGHLVLSALHANDAPGVLRRILDMGLPPYLVNSTLTGIMASRLVRTLCSECKRPDEPAPWMREQLGDRGDIPSFAGAGCDRCNHTGYRGRTGLHELLEMNEPLRREVARNASTGELQRTALANGMRSLLEDGLSKVERGVTSLPEVLKFCPLPPGGRKGGGQ